MLGKNEQIELAAKLLGLTAAQISEYGEFAEGLSALYVSIPEKGGASLIVGKDGSVLYADSSVGYSRHIQEYKDGKRTPAEAFNKPSNNV